MPKNPNLNLSNKQINDLITAAEDHGVSIEIESDEKASRFFSDLLFETSRALTREQAEKYNSNI